MPISSYSIIMGKLMSESRYVSRANPKDKWRHAILSTQTMRPSDFAHQLNISLANGWGIVRTITDLCLKQPEGKYVLIKDPNRVGIVLNLSKHVCFLKIIIPARYPLIWRSNERFRCRR